MLHASPTCRGLEWQGCSAQCVCMLQVSCTAAPTRRPTLSSHTHTHTRRHGYATATVWICAEHPVAAGCSPCPAGASGNKSCLLFTITNTRIGSMPPSTVVPPSCHHVLLPHHDTTALAAVAANRTTNMSTTAACVQQPTRPFTTSACFHWCMVAGATSYGPSSRPQSCPLLSPSRLHNSVTGCTFPHVVPDNTTTPDSYSATGRLCVIMSRLAGYLPRFSLAGVVDLGTVQYIGFAHGFQGWRVAVMCSNGAAPADIPAMIYQSWWQRHAANLSVGAAVPNDYKSEWSWTYSSWVNDNQLALLLACTVMLQLAVFSALTGVAVGLGPSWCSGFKSTLTCCISSASPCCCPCFNGLRLVLQHWMSSGESFSLGWSSG